MPSQGRWRRKKAFFEAHYKRIAAKKAAALLEQANADDSNPEAEVEGQGCDSTASNDAQSTTTNSQVPLGEQIEVKIVEVNVNSHSSGAEMELEIGKMKGDDPVTEQNTTRVSSLVKRLRPSPVGKKKPAILSLKPSAHRRAPKVPASPAKSTASIHPRKDNSATPIPGKSPIDAINKRRVTSKSLHTLIYSTPAKEPDKFTTTAARKVESSRVAPGPYRAYKDCKTPLKTPTTSNANGVLKNPSATPCSENRRPRTPVAPSATGSKTTGPKWHILSAKLEEKFNAKEAEKVQLQTRLKVKAETELRKLRQSLCFKARPLPDFYKERETPKNHIKNVKTPLTHPQSPKLGRKPSPITLQGITSLPPETKPTKNSGGPKNVPKKKNQIPNPLIPVPEMIAHENTSPNIQLDQLNQE
ncbi:TPX2 (targeting protein for Xklp2) protein family [Actinidia rufa]|uniref:TPX2 (Targeting protein for Xklp2) protein family n=1 Tax=Actinidia rufa TaxID=165716 RepID=A0A7J0H7L3_9ERIC|nr:TPX2 (targeting protein for Xklp2) protein family [Actinidia rufa]